MGTSVSVKINLKGIENKVSPTALAKGKLAMANQMLTDMSPFVPRKSGDLSGSGQATKDGVRYPGPYARANFTDLATTRLGFFISEIHYTRNWKALGLESYSATP